MEKWILDDQIVNILKVGLSGFAFLVILLSYFLLRADQKRKEGTRDGFLKSIHRFNAFSTVFVVIVGGFSILELVVKPGEKGTSENCSESIERMVKLADSPEQSIETLKALIKNSSNACIEQDIANE
ncbi:MAG: hypothetical protein AAFX57_10750 [Bacteroidota bacterium]